jgi:hypothetical protein
MHHPKRNTPSQFTRRPSGGHLPPSSFEAFDREMQKFEKTTRRIVVGAFIGWALVALAILGGIAWLAVTLLSHFGVI